MAEFSPTDSALEGFRLGRENPVAIAVWAAIGLVQTVLTYWLVIPAAGKPLTKLMELSQKTPPDTQAVMAAWTEAGSGIVKIYPILIPIMLVLGALLSAAIMRAVLRPEQRSLGYLRAGADEARILVVMLVKTLILIGLTLVSGVIAGGLAAVIGAAGLLLGMLVFMAAMGLYLFIAVRLSLASPQSFAEKRIAIFSSWGLTAGRFGPILGCYLLAFILAVVVFFIGTLAGGAISAIQGLISGHSVTADFSSLAAFFTPAQVLSLVIQAVVGALVLAIMGSPPAVIYRAITSPRMGEV